MRDVTGADWKQNPERRNMWMYLQACHSNRGEVAAFFPPDPSWRSHIRLRSTSALLAPSSSQVYFFMTPQLFFLMSPSVTSGLSPDDFIELLRWRAYKRVLCTHTRKRKIGVEMFKIGQIKEEGWRISHRDEEIKKKVAADENVRSAWSDITLLFLWGLSWFLVLSPLWIFKLVLNK